MALTRKSGIKPIESYLKNVDLRKTDEEIIDSIIARDYLALKNRVDELQGALSTLRKQCRNNVVRRGGLDQTIVLKELDLLGLHSNEYDQEIGDNFLLASNDGGNTSAMYWVLADKSVIRLKTGADGLVQLASPEILDGVLWPLFLKYKQQILDKLNAMVATPFEQKIPGMFPWGPINRFAIEFQDCCSSWILEHFGDIGLNYKAIPPETEEDCWKITEFTDVYTQHSKDVFVKTFNANLPLLCGRYARRMNEHPKPYSYKPDEYAFTKLNLDAIVKEGECPTWDLALHERLENEEECAVFRAAVWQVYETNNTSRQLVYMYDPHGRSGKSAMLRAAFSHLSQSTQALQKQSLNNQFGFAKIWNKQLVTIGDNKNTMMLKSQIIHTATGGDLADVEYKGKDSFTARFRGHIWANGNVKLDIDTDAEHEVSRLVLFNINKPKSAQTILYKCDSDGNIMMSADGTPLLRSGDPSWEEKLKAELPHFLYKCRQDYAVYCPRDSDLVLPDFMQERIQTECVELNKIVFDDFFNSCLTRGGEITDAQLRDAWKKWKDENIERYETTLSFTDLTEHLSKLKFKCVHKKLPNGKRLRTWPNISLQMNEGT